MSDKFLVPGAKVRLTLKSNERYEGVLVSVEEDGKITLGHVVSLGTAVEKSQPSTAAEYVLDEHVVFQQSDLKEVAVLVNANPSLSVCTAVKKVEGCIQNRAIAFSSFVLHFAIKQQDVECVQLLLKYGASVHEENELAETPWWCFFEYEIEPEKEARIVQLLLQHGASPTTCTSRGFFQGESTLKNGNKDAIRELLRYNLDFTAVDEYEKKCVLHYLAMNTNAGIVEELKCATRAINVNVRDEKGRTPLHSAAKCANVDMVAFLLGMGAEVDCQTIEGFTPLYYTGKTSHRRNPKDYHLCVELLLQHYADPQFVVTEANGERVTFFEAASIAKNLIRAKPFVAQLAYLEGLGTAITEIIRGKISSYPALEEHLNGCRRLLKHEISGSVNLLKLLSADKKKVARFLDNQELALRVEYFVLVLTSSCSYYYNWLKARYSEGARYKVLKREAAQIIRSIFTKNVGDIDENHLIVDGIIDFLDEKSLMNMSKVSAI